MTTTIEVKTVPIQYAEVPRLDHDADMEARFGSKVGPRGTVERRIVWNLCLHLAANGWTPIELNDGDEITDVADAKAAMELIFNLDDSTLIFRNEQGRRHWVRIILGNGIDAISDWSYDARGTNNFDAAMKAFESERCA